MIQIKLIFTIKEQVNNLSMYVGFKFTLSAFISEIMNNTSHMLFRCEKQHYLNQFFH